MTPSPAATPSRPLPPGGGAGAGLSDLGILRRILGMALRYRAGMAVALATTVLAALFQLLIPQYLGRAVDTAQGLLASGGNLAAIAAKCRKW